MNRNQDIFEQIEAYLEGSLKDAEKYRFEAEMKSDPELRTEVEKHRRLQDALKNRSALEFRSKVMAIEKRQESDRRRTPYWKAAAVILFLIGLSTFIWINISNGEEPLFDSYYTPYPIEAPLRGQEDHGSEETFHLYDQGKYKEAIAGLEILAEQSSENEQLKVYLGICYLEIDEVHAALEYFESVASTTAYFEDAQWYRALAYLKNRQEEQSLSVLIEIIAYDGIYKDKAESLRRDIENQPDGS
jgi:hypothetical protein